MTPEVQEALSHQHSHGLWVVPLESERVALFTHPNGHLITIVEVSEIADYCHNYAAMRAPIARRASGLALKLDL